MLRSHRPSPPRHAAAPRSALRARVRACLHHPPGSVTGGGRAQRTHRRPHPPLPVDDPPPSAQDAPPPPAPPEPARGRSRPPWHSAASSEVSATGLCRPTRPCAPGDRPAVARVRRVRRIAGRFRAPRHLLVRLPPPPVVPHRRRDLPHRLQRRRTPAVGPRTAVVRGDDGVPESVCAGAVPRASHGATEGRPAFRRVGRRHLHRAPRPREPGPFPAPPGTAPAPCHENAVRAGRTDPPGPLPGGRGPRRGAGPYRGAEVRLPCAGLLR